MKTSGTAISLALGLLLGSVEATPTPQNAANKCAQNNCLRQVIAGSFPNRPTVADCSSFLRKTVTPSVVTETAWVTITPVIETATTTHTDVETEITTVTVVETVDETETVTTFTTAPPIVNKRQVTVHPTAIPSYASACRSAEAYSSACSCIGVDPTTTTVATPTVVVTSTSTVTGKPTVGAVETLTTTMAVAVTEVETRTSTATATVVIPFLPEKFRLRASGGREGVDGAYLNQVLLDNTVSDHSFTEQGSVFSLDGTGQLFGVLRPSQPLSGAGPRPFAQHYRLFFMTPAWAAQNNFSPVTCSISNDDFEFTCVHFEAAVAYWYECSGRLMIGIAGASAGACQQIQLYAERA